MRRKRILLTLLAPTLFAFIAACGSADRGTQKPDQRQMEEAVSPGDVVPYEGPRTPADTEWLLESLDGRDAAEGSDINLVHLREEVNVEGGCMGFFLVNELEGDRLRVVKPGLQVGRLDCGRPEAVRRQAESILEIIRHLARVRVTEDRFELVGDSGRVAAFVRPPPARVAPAFVGTEWSLTSLEGEAPLPNARITLEVGREQLGGEAGCNYYGGQVDAMDRGEIAWENGNTGFGMTAMGCSKDVLDQETRYLDALIGTRTYHVEGDRLAMKNGEGRTTLVFKREPQWRSDPAELVGTSWMLRSTDGKKPLEGSVPTVRFEADKKVTWYDGCQNFDGRYFATENDLTVPDLGVVGGDCMKPEAHAPSDGACVVGCFGPEGDYRLRDGLLEIRSETGETTSILEPLRDGEEPEQEGTPWELRSFVEDGETTSVVGTAPITLTFDRGTLRREGTFFGSAGCNDYRVTYEYPTARNTLDRIFLAEPVTTRRACPKSDHLSDQEQRFLEVLDDLGSYPNVSANGRMTLDTGDGRELIFSAPE